MYKVCYNHITEMWEVLKNEKVFMEFYTKEVAQENCDRLNNEDCKHDIH